MGCSGAVEEGTEVLETTHHILFDCCRVAHFRRGIEVGDDVSCHSIWEVKPSAPALIMH